MDSERRRQTGSRDAGKPKGTLGAWGASTFLRDPTPAGASFLFPICALDRLFQSNRYLVVVSFGPDGFPCPTNSAFFFTCRTFDRAGLIASCVYGSHTCTPMEDRCHDAHH